MRLSVGVVITTYNHARFLGEAIESVLAQTRTPSDVLVVDDGSADNPAAVVARYPGVRLVRQSNQGLAAARNTGLRELATDKVVFLDADDRLLPAAVETGLACFAVHPECGFVYGGYRRICSNGRPSSDDYYNAISSKPYGDFLEGNPVGMHAAVMYDRARLAACGGFDATLDRSEDYDVYLRMSRSMPVASHPAIIAEYRWHGGNMSARHSEMLESSLRVHRRQADYARAQPDTAAAWRRGATRWRQMYVERMVEDVRRQWNERHSIPKLLRGLRAAASAGPSIALREVLASARRRLLRAVSPIAQRSHDPERRPPSPQTGSVNLGDLDRTSPVSQSFGFDRGTPVDRYYIERFLGRHASDIAGRVLEVKDNTYCRRFGGPRVTRQDVLDLGAGGGVTIAGDLCDPRTLPAGTFDCLVITQTLQFIFDVRTAVVQMHRALKPGGVALVTLPGISRIEHTPRAPWCWSFSLQSAHRLFSDVFGSASVRVESHGNVYAATAFLQGLAVEELKRAKLDVEDDSYPVVLTVRARKATGFDHGTAATHPAPVR
jgi:glycosyltransferase involved in cell wall biosynthesis/SAM-dependent methyltransferase